MNLQYTILSQHANQWILAFYGYGQQASIFKPLAKVLQHKYNILVIDLPSQPLSSPIEKEDFIADIKELMHQYQFKQFVGLSYSMGSRFNLVLAEYAPESISKMILVAPDGIRLGVWNRISTSSLLGNYLFKKLVNHPSAFIQIIGKLYSLKFISKSMYAFAKWNMRDYQNRQKVYDTWMNMKKMQPDLQRVNVNQLKHHFDIIGYFGKYDEVINATCMKKLQSVIPSSQVIVLNDGHNLLNEELFEKIAKELE